MENEPRQQQFEVSYVRPKWQIVQDLGSYLVVTTIAVSSMYMTLMLLEMSTVECICPRENFMYFL